MGEIADALRRARQGDPSGPLSEAPTRTTPGPTDLADAPLAHIPTERTWRRRWRGRTVLVDPSGAAAERYRQFALRVRRTLAERGSRSIAVTSALRAEGKTTTACNLALALADLSSAGRVALIDLDLRRPSVATGLGIEPRPHGLEAALAGQVGPEEVRLRTQLPSLDLYPTRSGVARAHEWLSGNAFGHLMDWMEARYDCVVVDTSPVLLASDTILALSRIPTCLLATTVGTTRHKALREMLRAIPQDGLIGCFVNRAKAPAHTSQYGYYQDPPASPDAKP